MKHLHSHNDNLQQLQTQFERLAALGMIFVTGAHEEVLKFPPQSLLFLFLMLLLWETGAPHSAGTRAAIAKELLRAVARD